VTTSQARVIVLSGQTLFAEGIAARLSLQLGEQNLLRIDARQPGAMQRIIDAHPAAVILDATDENVAKTCPIGVLLSALPALKIIRLNPLNDHIQVVTSHQRQGGQVQDIVDLIVSIKED